MREIQDVCVRQKIPDEKVRTYPSQKVREQGGKKGTSSCTSLKNNLSSRYGMDFAVKIGTSKERTITVNSSQTTSFLWKGENVLSTPSMIAEMEETCRLLLKEQVIPDSEWDSVGTVVKIEHLAATPVGVEVFFKAEVVSVDGRRIIFKVEARDKLEKIGEGTHERFIINIPRFRAKFNEKQKQLQM
jgi:fluoroacetyl-CoA thioesterase